MPLKLAETVECLLAEYDDYEELGIADETAGQAISLFWNFTERNTDRTLRECIDYIADWVEAPSDLLTEALEVAYESICPRIRLGEDGQVLPVILSENLDKTYREWMAPRVDGT